MYWSIDSTDMSLARSFPTQIIHDYDTSPKNDLHCCRIIGTASHYILFYNEMIESVKEV